ncbi:MAG TPA: alkaline phosphatase family protein [Polyangiaceae bacterium]|nr:alkaline phosphatase family protein [Polyangiaceae bacterium]
MHENNENADRLLRIGVAASLIGRAPVRRTSTLIGAAIACAALSATACGSYEADATSSIEPLATTASVTPSASGISHVVVVMMENRSFDHFLGWLPGADGRQAGLSYADRDGILHTTHPLAPDYRGCAHPDPDHSYAGGRVEYADGACDGWLRAGSNDDFAIGYYERRDLSFFSQAVTHGTALDRYFAAILAETYPNRIYQHAAQVDRITNTLDISTLPTIWDRLSAAGRSGRYYYSDVPFLALWGAKYLPISRPLAAFVVDATIGNLPDVAFVDPPFLDEDSGTSSDDHPHADIRRGEAFLNLVYSAVTLGPARNSTLLIVNYDEWGGFFDHVPPPTAPIPDTDRAAGNEDGRLGFRTPALLIGPWAAAGAVSHIQFDHTSVLKLIEWRWSLEPLSVRDASANNLADALDFKQKTRHPLFFVPPGPISPPCPSSLPHEPHEEVSLSSLQELAQQFGFPQPPRL